MSYKLFKFKFDYFTYLLHAPQEFAEKKVNILK